MMFVFITMACNAPFFINGAFSSFKGDDYKDIWKLTSDYDVCVRKDVKSYGKSFFKYWFLQLQFIQVIFILIYILKDPFTYRYIKINVVGCHSKRHKKSRKNEK